VRFVLLTIDRALKLLIVTTLINRIDVRKESANSIHKIFVRRAISPLPQAYATTPPPPHLVANSDKAVAQVVP
jgi:hypothetical protein